MARAAAATPPRRGQQRAILERAPERLVLAMNLSRFVLREDGSVMPLVSGALMDQPNWFMDAIARYHACYVRAKKEKRKK